MVRLERAIMEDAALFAAFEQEADARSFILPYDAQEHVKKLLDPGVVYLRILAREKLVGFFILALEKDNFSVEFRRIVIAHASRGIGQTAISLMEAFVGSSSTGLASGWTFLNTIYGRVMSTRS